jgi:hypothetical protein
MTLSFVGLTMPTMSPGLLALVGATTATLGRTILAKLSRHIVRTRLLDDGEHPMWAFTSWPHSFFSSPQFTSLRE